MRLLVVRLGEWRIALFSGRLGGIAFVNPPRRPGAYLWSIAAGPLVNVALVPILAAAGNFVSQSENSVSSDRRLSIHQ